MPEQFIGIKQIIKDQTNIPRPIVTQGMKEEIERALLESMKLQKTILISYYQDGQILYETVVTKAISRQNRMVFFQDFFGVSWGLGMLWGLIRVYVEQKEPALAFSFCFTLHVAGKGTDCFYAWRDGSIYVMEIELYNAESELERLTALPCIRLSKFEYDNLQDWKSGCSPSNHWRFYYPLH